MSDEHENGSGMMRAGRQGLQDNTVELQSVVSSPFTRLSNCHGRLLLRSCNRQKPNLQPLFFASTKGNLHLKFPKIHSEQGPLHMPIKAI